MIRRTLKKTRSQGATTGFGAMTHAELVAYALAAGFPALVKRWKRETIITKLENAK